MDRESKIFFVWNPKVGQWRKKHETFEGAQFEAERLAKENPGQEFFVLAALGRAYIEKHPDVFTEFYVKMPMPF